MPILFYSLSTIIVSAVASLILFLRIKKNQLLTRRLFFWHYAFGFAILSLVNFPIFFINLGFQISYNFLVILYCISFFAVLFSYLLFYRGTISLFTKDKFLTLVFPIIFLPVFAVVSTISFFLLKIDHLTMYTAVVWGFLLPINGFLGSLFLYFFLQGAPYDSIKRRQFYSLILSLGWFLLLFVDILLWFEVAGYPHMAWILKIASVKGWFLLRSLSYLLILIGSLIYSKHLQPAATTEKM